VDGRSRPIVQIRHPTAGQAYYRRKRAEGKSSKEALRCLKWRLSDTVYRCLLADQTHHNGATVKTS
jgi:transposase